MMKVSILCPTRGRPAGAIRLANSIHKTAKDKSCFEVWFYVDNDDPKRAEYEEKIGKARNSQVRLVVGPRESVSRTWNVIAKHCTGDVLMMGNDDLVFRTEGWDTILEHYIKQFKDDIYVAYFNDGINGKNLATFPIVSRKWYETLGYFTPGVFMFLFNDVWIMDIGRRVGRLHYIPEVYAEHLHHSVGKMEADDTTREARQNNMHVIDRQIYDEMANVRENHANKIRNVMNG
jgi:glycosyl transferase/beta-hydroxylase protein BlmF